MTGGGMKRRIAWMSVLVVVTVGAVVVWKGRVSRESLASKPHALAIVDFRDVAPPGQNVSAGLTDLLRIGLTESAPCRIVSAEYLYDVRRRLFGSAGVPIMPDEALEVARKSGADVLLTGQCVWDSTGYHVAWQLVDTGNGDALGARRVSGNRMTSLANDVIRGVLPLLSARYGARNMPGQTPVEVLTTTSGEAYTRYLAGMAALERASSDEAIREFNAAVEIDSSFALAWFGLARANGGRRDSGTRGDGEAGCRAGERAWTLRSRLSIKDRMLLEAWLGRTCRDDAVGAIETHREILSRWPDDREAASQLAEMLTWIHLAGEAVPVAEAALRNYPDDANIKFTLANALSAAGRSGEALVLYKQVAGADAKNPDRWDDLGLCYVGLGLPDSADAAFKKALEIEPSFTPCAINLAMSPFYRGETKAAIEALRRIDSSEMLAGDEFELTSNISRLLAERGQFEAAFALGHPRAPRVLQFYMYSLLSPDTRRHDELRSALKEYQEQSKQEQSPIQEFRACWAVVNLALSLDSLAAARPPFEKMQQMVPRVFPSNAFWWMTCAEFVLADGSPADALSYLKQVERRAIWPGSTFDIRRRTCAVRALRMLRHYDDAVSQLNEMRRLYPGHYLAEYEMAQVYDEMNRPRDAKRLYATFLEHWSDADTGLVQVETARSRLLALEHAP